LSSKKQLTHSLAIEEQALSESVETQIGYTGAEEFLPFSDAN
jgi:hypothetical protein